MVLPLNMLRKVKEELYDVVREDIVMDYENGIIKFRQEFPDEPPPGNTKVSEYALWDWFARAKGLGRSVAMELSQNDFLIRCMQNGGPDVNKWDIDEQIRWYKTLKRRIEKEIDRKIKEKEDPDPHDKEDLDKYTKLLAAAEEKKKKK